MHDAFYIRGLLFLFATCVARAIWLEALTAQTDAHSCAFGVAVPSGSFQLFAGAVKASRNMKREGSTRMPSCL